MASKRLFRELIGDLDRASAELGKAVARLSAPSGVLATIRRTLWELLMTLEAQKQLCLSAYGEDDEARCEMLRQLSQSAGKEALPLLQGIMADPDTPPRVAEVARLAIQRIEQRTSKTLVEELDRRLGARLEHLLRPPVLQNFEGFICARWLSPGGKPLPLEEGTFQTTAGRKALVQVCLQPERPEEGPAEAISIRDGSAAREVSFEITLDSDTLDFAPGRGTITVAPGQASARLDFTVTNPLSAGKHEVWVQAFQCNRLIQVVLGLLEVADKAKGAGS